MAPFIFSPHPMTPFSTFVSNFTYKLQTRFARAFWEIDIVCSNLTQNWQIAFLHTKWHSFLGVHSKKNHIFLEPTPNDPLFQWNFTPNAPYFRDPVGTCTSLSYSNAPPGFPFHFCKIAVTWSRILTDNEPRQRALQNHVKICQISVDNCYLILLRKLPLSFNSRHRWVGVFKY